MKNIPALLLLVILTVGTSCSKENLTAELNTDQLVEDLKVLSSDEMEGRRTGTEGNARARAYLLDRYAEEGAMPFKGSYTHSFTFDNRRGDSVQGINVIGQVKGEIDSVIVITAHYDHLGMRDSLIYNGADDDASGVAALLAYLDYFQQVTPRHTLVFAAFDAEEMGLRGARAFTEDSVFMDKVALNINLDMIGNNENFELYASGTYHYPSLKPVLQNIETGELKLLFGHDEPGQGYNDWTYASDHAAFHSKGKPFIYFGVEDHQHYHQPTDEFETIPLDFYKQSAKVILRAIQALDHR